MRRTPAGYYPRTNASIARVRVALIRANGLHMCAPLASRPLRTLNLLRNRLIRKLGRPELAAQARDRPRIAG
jgi:hypothetical protein